MRKITFFIALVVLTCLAHDSAAVSPMPIEELKPGQTAIACAVRIVYAPDRDRGIPEEVYAKTLFFEVASQKKDVLEEMTRYVENKLDKGNVTEVKLECKFPK